MSSHIEIPSWLDEQFVEQALKEAEGNNVKIKQIQVRGATSPGDHYSSNMYRVLAEYHTDNDHDLENRKKNFIVKAMLDNERINEYIDQRSIFSAEIDILGKIIPEFHRLINTSPDAPILFGPRCYLTSNKSHQKLVMDDLCELGFKLASRVPGLDLNHSRLVVSRLGMYHAASVALHSQEPELFENFLSPMHIKGGELSKNFVTQSFVTVAEKVKLWPNEEGQIYSEKLRHLSTSAMDRLLKSEERNEQGFNVLNHSDVWTNNMMFKYNEDGEVIDMIFLDFSGAYYGPPTLDLQYFLYTSPTPEVRSCHLEELIECYHISLSKTLAKLVCKQCPSLDDLHVEMKNRSFMAAYAFFCARSLATASKDSLPNMDKLTGASSETSCAHITADFDKEMQVLLPIFDKEGLFN